MSFHYSISMAHSIVCPIRDDRVIVMIPPMQHIHHHESCTHVQIMHILEIQFLSKWLCQIDPDEFKIYLKNDKHVLMVQHLNARPQPLALNVYQWLAQPPSWDISRFHPCLGHYSKKITCSSGYKHSKNHPVQL